MLPYANNTNLVCGLIHKVNFATPDLLTEGRRQSRGRRTRATSSVTLICGHLLGDLYSCSLLTCLFWDLPFWMLCSVLAIQIEVTRH
jgi:hypothetical protein